MKNEWTGDRFKRWRTEQGKRWTQTFTADRLGVSRKQISDWENGRTAGIDRRTVLACCMISDARRKDFDFESDPIWNANCERVEGRASWNGATVKYWVSREYLSDLIQSRDHLVGEVAIWALKQNDLLISQDLSIRAAMGFRDQNGYISLGNWT